ncbi:sensor histidine kinase [Actinomadura craniellae]|uniref:histidine kinase n=1 Tax=Actinomadura craniellae TaxID=2231787 RepID=A0A365HC18_9ACTN|nr:histidine kinase [Actinomadura craniellae]RAY16641.1 sensor histidine kinase [Actinomadura craniellae]
MSLRGSVPRTATGLVLGAVSAAVELAFLVLTALGTAYALVFSRGRRMMPRVTVAGARWLTGLERRRLAVFLGDRSAEEYGPLQALAYLVLRVPLGLLGGLLLVLLGYGLAVAVALPVLWLRGEAPEGIRPTPFMLAYLVVAGAVLLFLDLAGLVGVAELERRLMRRCLGPSPLEAYERRIAQLAVTRAEVIEAVDDERRRIERDLHDGVQQRLVALAMLIGRARRAGDADRAAELLRQAHEESQRAMDDLREVAWRVYPATLDEEGLRAALETVAERSAVPVEIDYSLAGRPPRAVETAAYFVVCEAVTNAAKHSGAGRVTVRVARRDTMIVVRIDDDGSGGADPSGGGLAGLARRVAALDGRLLVDSPPGGPTAITAELPCG